MENNNGSDTIEARLEKLEKQNRQWKLTASVSLLGMFFAVCLTSVSAKEKDDIKHFDTLDVGTLHAKLVRLEGPSGDFVALDSGIFGDTGIFIGSKDVGKVVQMYIGTDGSPHLALRGAEKDQWIYAEKILQEKETEDQEE